MTKGTGELRLILMIMNKRIPFKVVSGGQTGFGRATLDTAIELGILYGGWLVYGREPDEGPLPERYVGMIEWEDVRKEKEIFEFGEYHEAWRILSKGVS